MRLPGAAHPASFVFRRPAPHPRILVRGHGELQAVDPDRALPTHGLGRIRVGDGVAGRPDGKEEIRIAVAAGAPVAPVLGVPYPVRGPAHGRATDALRAARESLGDDTYRPPAPPARRSPAYGEVGQLPPPYRRCPSLAENIQPQLGADPTPVRPLQSQRTLPDHPNARLRRTPSCWHADDHPWMLGWSAQSRATP